MILNINIPQHTQAIARYITEEMSASEKLQFEATVNAHPENIELINEMKTDWTLIGESSSKKPNADKAWDRVYAKLMSDSLIESKPTYTKSYSQEWMKVAATVFVILTLGSLFLLINGYSKDTIVRSMADGSTLVHTMSDGSIVYLEPNTTLTYSKRFGLKSRSVKLTGQAFFEVAKNENLPFSIVTPDANVKVLGTSFTVRSVKGQNFEVIVETGTVSIAPRANNSDALVAVAGDKVTMANNRLSKISLQKQSIPTRVENRFQFKDETLANIVGILNRTYGVKITIAPNVDLNRRITVTFQNNSVPHMVDVICATLGLRIIQQGDTLTLWQP